MKKSICLLGSFLFFACANAQADRILLNPEMVTLEEGTGDPGMIADEQNLVTSEPVDGAKLPEMFTAWSSKRGAAHMKAYIDLGQVYSLEKIYLYDRNGDGPYIVSYGTPGNWHEIIRDDMLAYREWRRFNVDVQTRYLRIENTTGYVSVPEMILYGDTDSANPVAPQPVGRIQLSPDMVTMEVGSGDPGMIADEQNLVTSEPEDGAKLPEMFTGWSSKYGSTHMKAYIDLGQVYSINKIYLYDRNSDGTYIVSSGTPGNWTEVIRDQMLSYRAWRRFDVNIQTRYLRIENTTGYVNVPEMVLYGGGSGGGDVDPPSGVVSRIELTPNMFSLEANTGSTGDPGLLADEQAKVPNEPEEGSALPETFNSWNSNNGKHRNLAVLDLGREVALDRMYIYDRNGIDPFIVSTGQPGAWKEAFRDGMESYRKWKKFPMNGVVTRYVRFENSSGYVGASEIVLYGADGSSGGSGDGSGGGSGGGSDDPVDPDPVDTVAPVISLLGSSPVTIKIGSAYVDAGAKAVDDQDGDISSHIQVTDRVNVSVAGTYYVTYKVSDAAGNSASKSRTVVVQASSTNLIDAALGKPAIASTEKDSNSRASYVTDGNPASGWNSDLVRPYSYVEVDLQGYYSLEEIELELGTTTGNAPVNYEMQAYNHGCWKTIPETVVTGGSRSDVDVVLPLGGPVVTNKLRFYCRDKVECQVRGLVALGTVSSASNAPEPSCAAGQQTLRRAPSYDHLVFLPANYNSSKSSKVPLIFNLHGVGGMELSVDHTQVASNPEGISKKVKNDSSFRASFPGIIISPHCREIGSSSGDCYFDLDRLDRLWKDVMDTYRVDPDRITIAGLSGGGYKGFPWAVRHKDEIAAMVGVATLSDKISSQICELKGIATWIFHGTSDGTVPYSKALTTKKSLDACGTPRKAILTLYKGVGHNSWDRAYGDSRFYTWVLAQRRGNANEAPTYREPVAVTGSTVSIKLPTSSAVLTGSASDPDGSIARRDWVLISKPSDAANPAMSGASSDSLTVSGISKPGSYKFRYIATDSQGVSDYADRTLYVAGP